jgi:hypothetical protein
MAINLDLDGMEQEGRKEFTTINRFKAKEGTSIFRVLPPFGKDHANRASKKIRLHWGFFDSNGKPRPVHCTYESEGFCPICNHAWELEKMAQRSLAAGNTEESEEQMKKFQELKSRVTYLYNAVNNEGEVGVLEVPKTAHDGIISIFKEYINKYDLDPTGLKDGVWFQIRRSGKGFNTKYEVNFNRVSKKVDGEIVETINRSPLPEGVVSDFENLAVDIHNQYKIPSSSDLKKILDGAPVDEVFGKNKKTEGKKALNLGEDEDIVPPKTVSKAKMGGDDVFGEIAPPKTEKKAAPKAEKKEDDWEDILKD